MRKLIKIGLLLGLFIYLTAASSCRNKQNSAKEYIDAVNKEDYQKAHEILDNLYANYLENPDGEKNAKKYWTAADYIYKAEMQWLLPQNDPEADRRLIYTLDSMNPPGVEPLSNYRYGLSEHNKQYKKFSAYCTFAEEFNKLCIELIKISLRNENVQMAELTLKSMKTCYTKQNEGDVYIYEPNTRDKDAAKELIQQYKKENL